MLLISRGPFWDGEKPNISHQHKAMKATRSFDVALCHIPPPCCEDALPHDLQTCSKGWLIRNIGFILYTDREGTFVTSWHLIDEFPITQLNRC